MAIPAKGQKMFSISETQHSLTVNWDGQEVLGYHFPEDGNRPYCHPLRLPGGPPLTMNEPGDHVHHQGMWVAWKKVNGVNFWEQPAPGEDAAGFGKIVPQRIIERRAGRGQARIIAENRWLDWQGVTHLTERRQLTLGAPETAKEGFKHALRILVELEFRPNEREVILDLRRGEPGADGRFYSGLAIRFDNVLTPGSLLDADGRTEPMDIFGQQSRWCSFTSRHPADGEIYGAAIVDDVKNPRSPTTWWVRNRENYCLIHPSLVYYEPLCLAADEVLKLRYFVVLYRGQPDVELFEKLADSDVSG